MDQISHLFTVFMAFFAIMNPIANTPVFLGLTAEEDQATRRRIALRAHLLSFLIVLLFAAAGQLILQLFGITLSAFRITGGILILLVGYQMLHGGDHSSVQHPSEEDKEKSLEAELAIAITPLAMPILAGPGTIATAMSYASSGGLAAFVLTMGAFFLLCLVSYVFFVSGERFVRFLGRNGIKVISRLMGLLLAVIGVQMLIHGIEGAVVAFDQLQQ